MITPTRNRLLVKPDPKEKVIKGTGGIELVLTQANIKQGGTLRWATVEAIGAIDKDKSEPAIRVGSRVLINDYDGYEVQGDKDGRVLIPVEGIYGVE